MSTDVFFNSCTCEHNIDRDPLFKYPRKTYFKGNHEKSKHTRIDDSAVIFNNN